MKHLGSHNNWLLSLHTLGDDSALNTRNLLDWHLNTQITTGNHDAVASINDFINIIYTLLVFNLRNNLDITVVSIQDVLNSLYICCTTHK